MGRLKTVKARRAEWEDLNSKIEGEEQAKPVSGDVGDNTNVFRKLDVEGETKTSDLPYAYLGAKMVLPVFSGRSGPPPARAVPRPTAASPPKPPEAVDEVS